MKNLYTLLIVLVFTTVSYGQTRSINRFINQHKVQDNAIAISVPGWVFDLASFSTRYLDEEDEEVKELLQLTDKIKRIRILVIEEESKIEEKDVNRLLTGLQRDKFEELITVNSEGSKVRLMIKEKRDKIKNITAFIQNEGTTVLMSLSGKFSYDDIQNLKIWDEAENEGKLLKV